MKTWRTECVVLPRIVDQIEDVIMIYNQEKWSNKKAKERSVNWSKIFLSIKLKFNETDSYDHMYWDHLENENESRNTVCIYLRI